MGSNDGVAALLCAASGPPSGSGSEEGFVASDDLDRFLAREPGVYRFVSSERKKMIVSLVRHGERNRQPLFRVFPLSYYEGGHLLWKTEGDRFYVNYDAVRGFAELPALGTLTPERHGRVIFCASFLARVLREQGKYSR